MYSQKKKKKNKGYSRVKTALPYLKRILTDTNTFGQNSI